MRALGRERERSHLTSLEKGELVGLGPDLLCHLSNIRRLSIQRLAGGEEDDGPKLEWSVFHRMTSNMDCLERIHSTIRRATPRQFLAVLITKISYQNMSYQNYS
jgi:hypothetical protein